MTQLSAAEVRDYAQKAGFTGQGLDMMTAIANRESSFNPEIVNDNPKTGDLSVGLGQINLMGNLAPDRLAKLREWGYPVNNVQDAIQVLKDPAVNMRFAYYLSGGTNFQPWSTAAAAAKDIGAGGGTNMATQQDPAQAAQSNQIRKTLTDGINTAFAQWQNNPSDILAANAWQKAITALSQWDAAQADINTSQYNTDPAQRAFDNSLKMGDLNRKTADAAYSQWSDKQKLAADSAAAEIKSVQDSNTQLEKEATGDFATNGQGPKSNIATFYSDPYQKTLDRYKAKYGADTAAPDLNVTNPNVTLPAAAGAGGQGNQTLSLFGETGWKPGGQPLGTLPGAALNLPSDGGADATGILAGSDPNSAVRPAPKPYAPGNPWAVSGQDAAPAAAGGGGTDWLGAAGNAAATIGGQVLTPGSALGGSAAKLWWRGLGGTASKIGGLLGFATGTPFHTGGPAMMNEKGAETIIPAFGDPHQLPGGPQVADPGVGSAVIPANIPRDQALLFSQIRNAAMQQDQGGGDSPDTSPQAQMARANDPQLAQKVRDALMKAVAAFDALNPPTTPTMTHGGPDLWAHQRALTGVPANPLPVEAK